MRNYPSANSFEPGITTKLEAFTTDTYQYQFLRILNHFVVHNRLDIVLWDKHADHVKILNIAVHLDKNIQLTYTYRYLVLVFLSKSVLNFFIK